MSDLKFKSLCDLLKRVLTIIFLVWCMQGCRDHLHRDMLTKQDFNVLQEYHQGHNDE